MAVATRFHTRHKPNLQFYASVLPVATKTGLRDGSAANPWIMQKITPQTRPKIIQCKECMFYYICLWASFSYHQDVNFWVSSIWTYNWHRRISSLSSSNANIWPEVFFSWPRSIVLLTWEFEEDVHILACCWCCIECSEIIAYSDVSEISCRSINKCFDSESGTIIQLIW